MKVIVGSTYFFAASNTNRLYFVSKAIPHPKYHIKNIVYNDIGLLKVNKQIIYIPGFVEAISLSNRTQITTGSELNVAGWGKNEVRTTNIFFYE